MFIKEKSIIQNYALAARALRGDTAYHRYPQLDEVVSARLSNPITPKAQRKIAEEIKLYPNPNTGNFNLEVNSLSKQTFIWEIADLTGRSILTGSFQAAEGNNIFSINMLEATQGIYLLRIVNEDGTYLSTKRISFIK